MTDSVLFEVDGSVATITLNRPERLNSMNFDLLQGTLTALETVASDDAVRAVILTGAGRGFCAGGDLQGMTSGPATATDGLAADARPSVETQVARLRSNMRSSQLLRDMPKVTIAAINGPCAGAGLSWACACDIRFAAESAVFNTAFVTAGRSGDFGGNWTLPRIVGPGKARELYLLAERFDAAEALRIGLVSKVVPDADLLSTARVAADRVAGFAPITMQLIKANQNDSLGLSFSEMLDREATRHVQSTLTADASEAVRAFLEKRPPVFQGR